MLRGGRIGERASGRSCSERGTMAVRYGLDLARFAGDCRHTGTSCDTDVLYHYTDARGLIGIIGSGVLWATDAEFLNVLKNFGLGETGCMNSCWHEQQTCARPTHRTTETRPPTPVRLSCEAPQTTCSPGPSIRNMPWSLRRVASLSGAWSESRSFAKGGIY
jgi:hypothetical protein